MLSLLLYLNFLASQGSLVVFILNMSDTCQIQKTVRRSVHMGNRGISEEGVRMGDHATGKLHLRKCVVERN